MGELSPLRRRMIEDMTIRNMSPATQRSYISAVSKFSRYFGRSPDKLTLDDVHAFQVHLVSTGISWPGLNQIVCALRFFYGVTLGEAAVPERIPYARAPRKLPIVLSADEVVRFLEAVSSLKSRAALTTAYAAGLLASEVAGLRVEDVDSGRGVILVRHGKGAKDRNVMLSPQLLGILPTFDDARTLSATRCMRCRRQRSFSGSFPARLEAIGREKGVDPGAMEVWFADEARVGQKNKITPRWAKRPPLLSSHGKGAALVMPRCNTEAMTLHLAEIATQIAPGAHAALLVDQAGWHLSGRLIVPPNITLISFPAKCPGLNPQENIWQFMRENWLSNRIFKFFDDIVDHCCEAWNKLINQPWRIMSIGIRDWAYRS